MQAFESWDQSIVQFFLELLIVDMSGYDLADAWATPEDTAADVLEHWHKNLLQILVLGSLGFHSGATWSK